MAAGFSVMQPSLGDALQWLPAIGSPELDEMIHAYLPGPASISDKRAHISMDFFEYSRQTGENFKYYALPSASFSAASTASPASSAAFVDSGYSTFNDSPVVSDISSWTQSPAAFTPAYSFDENMTTSRASKKSPASGSKQTDFSSHPGMRIMTKDGRDVTNSASRGCKTKEQRDHAHLMRIIKACDACKRKKIRCDPSHKKRSASQASSSPTEAKPNKKIKRAEPAQAPVSFDPLPAFFVPTAFDAAAEVDNSFPTYESLPENIDWNEFLVLDEPTLHQSYMPEEFNFFQDSQDFFASSSSSSPSQASPQTPAPSGRSPAVISGDILDASLDPIVPYLQPGVAHGTNYADFNLYSSPRDFFLDEEPLLVSKQAISQAPQQESQSDGGVDSQFVSAQTSSQMITVAHGDEYYSSPYSSPTASADPHDGQHDDPRQLDEYRYSRVSVVSPQHRPQGPQPGTQSESSPSATQTCTPSLLSVLDTQLSRHDPGTLSSSHQSSLLIKPSVEPSGSLAYIARSSRTSSAVAATQSDLGYSGDGDGDGDGSPSPGGQQRCQQTSSYAMMATPSASTLSSVSAPASPDWRPSGSLVSTSSPRELCCTFATPIQSAVQATPEQSQILGGDLSASALNSGLETGLFSTLPMRLLAVGHDDKPSSSIYQLVVLGLVSFLLAIAMQAQFLGHQADLSVGLNALIMASITFTTLRRRSGLADKVSPNSWGAPATGIIDNVKTKIHTVSAALDGLRCAVLQRMRSSVPRLPLRSSMGLMG